MVAKIDPLDTPQQRAFERAAVRLMQDPAARASQAEVAAYWIDRIKPSADARARFESEFEQIAFSIAMESLNQDPLYPQIHAFGRFEHVLDGQRIPGTKVGNPNPDYIYRFIAIDGASRYVIHGEMLAPPPVAAEFSVLTPAQAYLANRSARHITFDADGRFTLTLDADPAGERPNHMQTGPDACQVLIRDILSDVAVQRPYKLTVERLGAAPRAAYGEEHALSIYGKRLRKFVDDLLFIGERMIFNKPVNTYDAPAVHQGGIYSVAQAYAAGHYRLQEDEAMVVTLTLGGAAYAVVPVNNIWGGLGDYLRHRGTIGTGRAAANPDGSYTCVVSARDPGVVNWVDTDGMAEGVMFLRWAGLSAEAAPPQLRTELVKLKDLESALPPAVPRMDATARKTQMARHSADYTSWLG
jgi:hypothetical protein